MLCSVFTHVFFYMAVFFIYNVCTLCSNEKNGSYILRSVCWLNVVLVMMTAVRQSPVEL